MAFRRMMVALVVGAVALAGCSDGDAEDAGVTPEEPIGAPRTDADYPSVPAEPPSTVSKAATVEMEVPRDELSNAAQAVVDLATSARVGGFLVSSVVDLDEGYGSGAVSVKVPSTRFEQAVADLAAVGDVTRQEMSGADLTLETVAAERAVRRARARAAALAEWIEATEDETEAAELRTEHRDARVQAQTAARQRAYVEAQAEYAAIDVTLEGRRPPPPPKKPALEQAVGTAKTLTVTIASGAIIAAGVVAPVGLVLVALYLVWSVTARRLRARWEQPT